MQLIVDAEATIGTQSKMSRIDEEILDGNLAKTLIDNYSNNIPHNGSGVLKNISLFDDNKEKEQLENNTSNDNSVDTKENLSKTNTLNSTCNSNKEKHENTYEVSEENLIGHQNIIVNKKQSKEKNEQDAVDNDVVKSDQKQQSLDLPKGNNIDLNNETIMHDEQCSAEDGILKLDSNFDYSSGSIEVSTNPDITNSSDLENILTKDIADNIKDAILEYVEENDKTCNMENEIENKMDKGTVSEEIAETDKIGNLENKVENKIDAISEKVASKDNISNLENEIVRKMDEDTVLEAIAENDHIGHYEIEADDKMNEDALLEEVAENDNVINTYIGNLEIGYENKMDEDTLLEEVSLSGNIGTLELEVKNKNDHDLVSEKIVGNYNTNNLGNDSEIVETNKISNLENEVEKELHENEISEKNLGHNEDIDEIEEKPGGTEKLSCPSDNNLNSNNEKAKKLTVDEEILLKDGVNIADTQTPIDKNYPSIVKSCHLEMSEKGEFTEKNEEKGESIKIKTLSTDDKIGEKDVKLSREIKKSLASKLPNTLDILSDDEDELTDIDKVIDNVNNCNPSISLVDDDDVMLIEEDAGGKKKKSSEISEKTSEVSVKTDLEKQGPLFLEINKEDVKLETGAEEITQKNELDSMPNKTENDRAAKPLLPLNVLKNYKKNLADMTREELEEFCISKIVEGVVNRSNLGDIKAQLKITARVAEEYKKKLMMISKQTRDLQVILKSVQEEQKKPSAYPVTPLKLTRSVGMQVFMTDKPIPKKRQQSLIPTNNTPLDKSNRNNASVKTPKSNQQIPVPRLVPAAATPTTKATSITQAVVNNAVAAKSPQTNNSLVNGLRNSPPAQKPEKRVRMQTYNTVDLTDDEPPTKIANKCSPTPPVRLVPPQNLMAPQRPPFAPNINSPRKVYIPISSPQAPNIRPGQTYLLKSVPPNPGPRPRGPANNVPKMPSNSIRMNRPQHYRHPAPLPDAMKQYQPPNWKALPPAPDLKLSKVDNGIVISWKIDGYQDDSYEEITSYQLFAYQETSSPPSTALWKKIGDVKALPLPMACTLTQFMAGYKYYFAVRAVDVKSRLGPFSLPGSILLLNKM